MFSFERYNNIYYKTTYYLDTCSWYTTILHIILKKKTIQVQHIRFSLNCGFKKTHFTILKLRVYSFIVHPFFKFHFDTYILVLNVGMTTKVKNLILHCTSDGKMYNMWSVLNVWFEDCNLQFNKTFYSNSSVEHQSTFNTIIIIYSI